MKMLTPNDVAAVTGLPYAKALLLVKSASHIQIGNRYYISETNLRSFLTQAEAIEIREQETQL